MNQEEESTTRVTRGALRRRSVDQDTSAGAGTPKKPVGKKAAVLNAIQEKDASPGTPSQNVSVSESVKNKKDTPSLNTTAGKMSLTRLRSRTTSLTEENLAMWDELQEIRRTPRRRPSQDVTPQTAPQSTRRTRRNSATSDDAPITTPIATRSRLSVAPPTIAEDDEKEDKMNNSNLEADLSDLDIRKLRNRSITNSPIPRTSPSLKNTSNNSHVEEIIISPKQAKVVLTDIGDKKSPVKSPLSDMQFSLKVVDDNEGTESKGEENTADSTQADSGKQLSKNVTFDEKTTLEWQNQSAYPKTPIATNGRRGSHSGGVSQELQEVTKATPEMFEIAGTDSDSPSAPTSATNVTEIKIVVDDAASESAMEPQQLDQSVDESLANIVQDVRENLNRVDVSMSVLDTPRPVDKQKSRLPQLREGTCSTPLPTVTEPAMEVVEENEKKVVAAKDDVQNNDSSLSKSWSMAVKGSTADKGIDVFSVRKQEEEERKEAEVKKLNESLKRKSLDVSKKDDEVDEEAEDADSEAGDEVDDRNSFEDTEAMEVDDYQSGDSLDSDMRAEMDDNAVVEEGESIGSQDSEDDDENEEDEQDSFIVTDEDEESLLNGSGDDLDDESKKSPKKKKSRILQQEDSSDEDNDGNDKDVPVNDADKAKVIELNSSSERSPEKSPKKKVPQSPIKSVDKQNSPMAKRKESLFQNAAVPTSRKSMPAPALISADFYSSSSKKAKRNTINAMALEDEEPADESKVLPSKRKSISGMVTAAVALAKKNKRLTLDSTPTNVERKTDKRISLPGKLSEDRELSFLSKKKSDKLTIDDQQKDDKEPESAVEPMEVDEDLVEEKQPDENTSSTKVTKKKTKDLSEFDHDAILSRCNEIVRADKEKKKQTATLRQKKKDEKRRQREQQQLEESTEANDESLEQSKKKKKKKKKPINYLLEELGEPKEDQLAKALQRRAALLEAKKLRKKAKKAAKLQQQLNKENQQGSQPKEGIGAKFEKKTKKKKDIVSKPIDLVTCPKLPEPEVKLMVSAYAVYKTQIEELKNEQKSGKKKSKQLKEKNHQPSTGEEVPKSLENKTNKEQKITEPNVSSENRVTDRVLESNENDKQPKKKKKSEKSEQPNPKRTEEGITKTTKSTEQQLSKGTSWPGAALIDLDEQLAKLKASLSEPICKVVKKQKLSQEGSASVQQVTEVDMTPPRKKLQMLVRLEAGGFVEEPMTPEQQRLKRNHGFQEEPITPKPIGFRVSSILPAGQEELRRQAVATKTGKKHSQSNRIRPEDVIEPVRSLPQPVWTRSGAFEVEDVSEAKGKQRTFLAGFRRSSLQSFHGLRLLTIFTISNMPDWRERDDSDRGYGGGSSGYDRERRDYRSGGGGYGGGGGYRSGGAGGGSGGYGGSRDGGGYRSGSGGGGFRNGGGAPRGPPRIDPATAKTETFEVDADKVKFIIGRGGNKIREIQDRCRVSVQIDKQRNENGQNNISVMGDQSNIDRARDMIDRIINDDRDREEHRRD
ncbi:protein slender lobes-like [Wyeomyia smithii]|uniref:protein slender lobes-like n=1 Tax=Wyeomyia smithii TaxID=174621 RepID=UPI002467E48F|nr:protein slender lobes-like [Wyeomyia smithii]